MIKLMIKNRREILSLSGKASTICDVVETSPEYCDPRPVKNMQNIDLESAQRYIAQQEEWEENWIPGF